MNYPRKITFSNVKEIIRNGPVAQLELEPFRIKKRFALINDKYGHRNKCSSPGILRTTKNK